MTANSIREGVLTRVFGSKQRVAEFLGGWTDFGIYAVPNRTGFIFRVKYTQSNRLLLAAVLEALPKVDGRLGSDRGGSTGKHHRGELGSEIDYEGLPAHVLHERSVEWGSAAEREARRKGGQASIHCTTAGMPCSQKVYDM
jgi:hypothetical protein